MAQRPKHIKKSNEFPRLNKQNHDVTSDKSGNYNCIAWAAGTTTIKWWPVFAPDAYWPPSAPKVETLDAFIKAYETLGYAVCADGSYVEGTEKIAIYTKSGKPVHAARQIDAVNWTSKLGGREDISHHRDVVSDGMYGTIEVYMSRPKS
jgi:hypothetical protein